MTQDERDEFQRITDGPELRELSEKKPQPLATRWVGVMIGILLPATGFLALSAGTDWWKIAIGGALTMLGCVVIGAALSVK